MSNKLPDISPLTYDFFLTVEQEELILKYWANVEKYLLYWVHSEIIYKPHNTDDIRAIPRPGKSGSSSYTGVVVNGFMMKNDIIDRFLHC